MDFSISSMMIPDYTAWNINHLPEQEQLVVFKSQILPHMMRFADGQVLRDIITKCPWLAGWMSHNFDSALSACIETPNTMTLGLREFINAYHSTLLVSNWQKLMNEALIEHSKQDE